MAAREPERDRSEVIDVRGQVVWARQVAPFSAGIRFLEVEEQQRALLAEVAPNDEG